MARIKLAYIGGGSTRAPGTMLSLIEQGENFQGSEIVLIDLDEEHLAIVKMLAEKMVRHKGLDLTIRATTHRRAGLVDCDAVLTSFRPGGFEARVQDERIPLRHGLIGQETQGPGGFFMALRTIHVMQQIVADMEELCPRAWLFNYTNPINIVSEAVSHHTAIPIVSLCEGPIIFPPMVARAAGLEPDKLEAVMIGLNHGCWSVQHRYEGADLIPLLTAANEHAHANPTMSPFNRRLLHLAATMETIPASYFLYYYFQEELLAELQAGATTRAEDILAAVPGYWHHYREQAALDVPVLDAGRSRGGLHELELAIDVMDAVFNDRQEIWPVNVPNQGALPDFAGDVVVEVPGLVSRQGITPLPQERLPRHVVGLVHMLAEYQALTAEAAWSGTRQDAIRALASNPLCFSLAKAKAVYDEMAAAHRDYLPARLLQ
jgi:6-phospho-beta-glucosidase